MSSTFLRISAVVLFLIGVCCFCFYPTHAPSSLPEEETGVGTSQQPSAPNETIPTVVYQETVSPSQPPPQLGDNNGVSTQPPTPSNEQSVTESEDEPIEDKPIEVNQENPGDITEPNPSLTPETPTAPPVNTAPESTNQIIKRVEGINNMIALTFDDGPYPQMTAQYLAVLDKLNVQATFFMIGQRIEYYPELARKVVQYGSEIGSHSWQHARLDQLTMDDIVQDLTLVENQVQINLGQEINLLRPPYGRYNDNVLAAAEQLGYKVITWDVDPRDWENHPPEKIVSGVLEQARPGSIVVMHEGQPNTLEALPVIIEKLREYGLEPVTVSEMLNQDPTQMESEF